MDDEQTLIMKEALDGFDTPAGDGLGRETRIGREGQSRGDLGQLRRRIHLHGAWTVFGVSRLDAVERVAAQVPDDT